MSIFDAKSQGDLAKERPTTVPTQYSYGGVNYGTNTLTYEQLDRMQMEQQMQQQMQMEQNMRQMLNNTVSASSITTPSPSKINEALDFKDWVRDTLPDVWDQYRAVKDIERCSK